MERTGGGILGRLGEKVLGWIALGALIFLGIAIYQMPAETKQAIWSGIWRTLLWLALVAAIPWGSRLFIRRIVEAGTNWAGAGLIVALTLLDVIVGVALMSVWPSGPWTWAAALGAVALAGSYNYLVTEYLAETSGP